MSMNSMNAPQILLLLGLASYAAGYELIHEYSGPSFFSKWDFYGGADNLTNGDVLWVNRTDAVSQRLAYINNDGRAIIKVDNTTTVAAGQKRNSVRIVSQDAYGSGSLWVIDVRHVPYGCSVWPAFWTVGPDWPKGGEIDIIEGVNLVDHNQMTLHTAPGCTHGSKSSAHNQNHGESQSDVSNQNQNPNQNQLGTTINAECAGPLGCGVAETSPNSRGPGFEAAGGGVWATQYVHEGIFIWFWSRPDIPKSIAQADSSTSLDPSQWGTPHAAFYTNTCNIRKYFGMQRLVLDITLCGAWAGEDWAYNAACGNSGPTGRCYDDCVVGPGSPRYDDAYFDITYIRAYSKYAARSRSNDHPLGEGQGSSGAVSARLSMDWNWTDVRRSLWGVIFWVLSMIVGALSVS